ncbi:hypothetical protein Chor_013877 [Crotalus horridus]
MLNPADNKFRGIFQKKTFESSRIHDNLNSCSPTWGYSSEGHEVLTDDGYYLQLNRIPHGKHCPRNESRSVT